MKSIEAQQSNSEQTLVLIKPDALLYSLTGFIVERVSAVHNPVIAALKVVRVTEELAREHYANIRGKSFYEATLRYIMGELHYPAQPEKRRVVASSSCPSPRKCPASCEATLAITWARLSKSRSKAWPRARPDSKPGAL